MFGIKYIKFDSMMYIIHYKNGKIVNEGRGLSFFYFAPNSSIAAIAMGSNDLPFIFHSVTSDYQTISVQGQITYKVLNPKQLAEVLDFSVNESGAYKKDDFEKMTQRIINEAQTATSALIGALKLRDALKSAKVFESKIIEGLKTSQVIQMLGIEILSSNILVIRATPEMERALETETREMLQQEADQAIYLRRNFAVEQERKIKESELNTEIAVEEKKKQIAEKKAETDFQNELKNRKIREMKIEADISVEEQRQKLLEIRVANERKEAETKGYVIETTLKPYKDFDWKTLMAMNSANDPKMNIALAFRELAEQAQKIGTLNITPDLLQNLMAQQ